MEPSPNVFLVAVDFFEPSLNAIALAARFARRYGGQVMAVHVMRKSIRLPDHMELPDDEFVENYLADQLREALRPLHEEGIATGFELRFGGIKEEILNAAEENNADAIFVGIREGSILADIYIGENTMALVRDGRYPVVVADLPPSSAPINDMLIPVDRRFGLRGIKHFMRHLSKPLTPNVLLLLTADVNEKEEDLIPYVEQLGEELKALGVQKVEFQIAQDEDRVLAMMEAIKREKDSFDLVLLEHLRYSEIGAMTLGSMVEEVVTQCRMPVFCAPALQADAD